MIEQHEQTMEGEMKVTAGKLSRVSSTVVVANPEGKTMPPTFARRNFEDALDRVSRPEKTPGRAS